MIKKIHMHREKPVINLIPEIVYGHRMEGSNAVYRPLSLSLMRPRMSFPYDEPPRNLPTIIWLCGGSFSSMDRNVWVPELAWFAKKGYAVASIDYSVTARAKFPDQIEDVKLAIRYLKAHAEELGLDPHRFIAMGESAGGYLAALVGATANTREYDKGDYLKYSSRVKAVVPWYPLVSVPAFLSEMPRTSLRKFRIREAIHELTQIQIPLDALNYPDVTKFITGQTPPFLILHGDADTIIPVSQSQLLYQALRARNVLAEFYIFEGAEHADAPFIQEETKQLILEFLQRVVV
ncbi:alpha/beta hydrolase fold domain-containing protein [Enterococcus olivae]